MNNNTLWRALWFFSFKVLPNGRLYSLHCLSYLRICGPAFLLVLLSSFVNSLMFGICFPCVSSLPFFIQWIAFVLGFSRCLLWDWCMLGIVPASGEKAGSNTKFETLEKYISVTQDRQKQINKCVIYVQKL